MTIISLDKTRADDGIVYFEIKDHSMADRVNDADLVCCSCSMLFYTLIESLGLDLQNKDQVIEKLNAVINENLAPEFRLKINYNDKTEIILNTILTGYLILQENYKQNVKVLTIF